jgi:hypothetical protein
MCCASLLETVTENLPGAALLAFEKWPSGEPKPRLVATASWATLRLPLGFARGFGKTGQAFSESVRSGAPPVG